MAQQAVELHTKPTLVSSAPAGAVALGLTALVSAYRRRGRFTLRIENLPQGSRLTAGRNNGDRSWSLALDELDELFYVPPESVTGDHVLMLRLISKEEGNASTLALIDLPISGGRLAIPHAHVDVPQAAQPRTDAPGEALSRELSSLKAELAGREEELRRMRATSEAVHGDWQAKLETAIAVAKTEWSSAEAPRADAEDEALSKEISSLKAELAGRDNELNQMRAASQSVHGDWQAKLETAIAVAKSEWSSTEASRLAAAKADHEKEVSALRDLKSHVATANTLLAQRESELVALKTELTQQRQKSEAEIAAARTALEAQNVRDAQRRDQSAKALLELKARCDEAEANLARQRQASEAEIAAAKKIVAAQGAAEIDKQEQASRALAELTARCELAEEKLSQQRQALEAEILAARKAAEEQDLAEASREKQAGRALAELQARCEAAEAELRSAQAAGEKAAAGDAYVRGLNEEIRNLQAVLVDREAAIARAEASLEQMQIGIVAKPAPAHWDPLPGGFTQFAKEEEEVKKPPSHLVRDFILVFAVVAIGCLVFFFGPPLVANLQQIDFGNLFASSDSDQDDTPAPAPAPAPAPPPKPKFPTAIVVRDVNLRAAPATSGQVIMALKHGTEVTVLERQGNWAHVAVVISGQESRDGWAYGSYLGESGPGAKP